LPATTAESPRRFTDVRLHPERLAQPLHWRKPRRIFVNSMSDLFHELVPFEFINTVWLRMISSPRHSFQILTKRPARMRAFFEWEAARSQFPTLQFPILPNVWLGVSVEDQVTAEERIPILLQVPAAVRFVSYEPALGPVDFRRIETHDRRGPFGLWCDALDGAFTDSPHIDWLIVGGESGARARPFDFKWARRTLADCRRVGVPFFFKQGGACHACPHDRAGGHIECFPRDLQVREFPALVEDRI